MENLSIAFSNQLIESAKNDGRVMVVDPEVARSTKMREFAHAHPNSFIEVGVAEQNAVGISAGLASGGNVVFCVSFAPFATMRPFEIIRTTVAYPKQSVRIVGAYAGFTDGKDGATHEALEDIANMRSIPGMCVVCPSDANMIRAITRAAIDFEGPMYIRLENEDVEDIYPKDFEFEIGKAYVLNEGSDVTVATYGCAVRRALEAADILKRKGVSLEVIDVATLKPYDGEEIIKSVKKTVKLITLEDHAATGALADMSAAFLGRAGVPFEMRALNVPDQFGLSGTPSQLRDYFKLSANDVVRAAEDLMNKREADAK